MAILLLLATKLMLEKKKHFSYSGLTVSDRSLEQLYFCLKASKENRLQGPCKKYILLESGLSYVIFLSLIRHTLSHLEIFLTAWCALNCHPVIPMIFWTIEPCNAIVTSHTMTTREFPEPFTLPVSYALYTFSTCYYSVKKNQVIMIN